MERVEPVPGVGRSGAEWIADHDVSMVCWDFLDAANEHEPIAAVHMLVWAIGLVLVDNCDLGPAAAVMQAAGVGTGGLVVSPLRIAGGTGCSVNPVLLL